MRHLTFPPFSQQAADAVRQRLDSLAKVPGSLGELEELAIRLGGITDDARPSFPHKAVVLFAGDHGITAKGVSATGPEVTAIQVRNFLAGGGTINAFCRNAGARLVVVDVGVADALEGAEGLVRRKVMPGSRDFSEGPAMTREEALAALAGFYDVVIAEERIAAEKARILHELAQRVREELVPVLPAMLGEVIEFDFRSSFALWA